jgi:hypothetical protein
MYVLTSVVGLYAVFAVAMQRGQSTKCPNEMRYACTVVHDIERCRRHEELVSCVRAFTSQLDTGLAVYRTSATAVPCMMRRADPVITAHKFKLSGRFDNSRNQKTKVCLSYMEWLRCTGTLIIPGRRRLTLTEVPVRQLERAAL